MAIAWANRNGLSRGPSTCKVLIYIRLAPNNALKCRVWVLYHAFVYRHVPSFYLKFSIQWWWISADYVILVVGIDMKCKYIYTHISYLCTKHAYFCPTKSLWIIRHTIYICDPLKITRLSKISNIRRTRSQNLNDSRLVLQLSLSNPLK